MTESEIWAAIDLRRGSVVSLRKGNPADCDMWSNDPLAIAERWEREGASGLHIVDLDGAFGDGSNSKIVESITRHSKIPVQVGGGIRSTQDAQKWLQNGATRVVLGTLAFSDRDSFTDAVTRLGSERVIVAADYRNGTIVTKGWTEKKQLKVLDAINDLEGIGIKTVLATAVDLDGMALGPDVETLRSIRELSRISILASGGIRTVDDVLELERIGINGVIVGRALYDETFQLSGLRERK